MDNQGLFGALEQYWTVNDKPRLDRKNTYFDDLTLSNADALRVGVLVATLAIAIVVSWSLIGVVL